jgi:N-methylhydantoinase B/oxoprolinase/acetone carboxylase alpha subunit
MSAAVDVKTLVIDGKNVSARAGQTILEVAKENNIEIPTLCHLDGLSDVGACRLCVVEIKGGAKMRGKGTQLVRPGERLLVMTPGGGGLGAPAARDPALVDQDLREERTSR